VSGFASQLATAKACVSGLIGVGGFIEGYIPQEIKDEKTMVFEFGSNGFFGYGAASPTAAMWWSTCQADHMPEQRRISPEDMQAQLKARHGSWKDPIVHECIAKSTVSQIYPTWIMPDLPSWSADGLVLVGDAAHALDPTSGQGASMALEDAQCFSLALSQYLEAHVKDESRLSVADAVAMSGKSLFDLRHMRIKKISDRTKMISRSKGDVGVVAEMMMCLMMWLMGKIPAIGKYHLM
jgi:2-polyprenyl-6-methoxyphenol hydroxylase-like FAD-dependent oxidoreductase